MSRSRMQQDEVFWKIVKDLQWKLDDGSGGMPPEEPEFNHGGGGGSGSLRWTLLLGSFMVGCLTSLLLLVAPPFVPVLFVAATVALATFALRRMRT